MDVVDAGGTVVGRATRAEMRAGNLRHRTVFIAVVTGDGAVVAHQRADWKDVWPSRWDVAFGGVVAVGESWDEAARRELAEEAGIDAPLEPVGVGRYDDGEVVEIAHLFVG